MEKQLIVSWIIFIGLIILFITFIIIASLLTFIGESVYYALEIILSEAEVQLIIFIRILLIEIIFNDLIIIIIYPVLNKIGEKLKMMLEDETNYIKYI